MSMEYKNYLNGERTRIDKSYNLPNKIKSFEFIYDYEKLAIFVNNDERIFTELYPSENFSIYFSNETQDENTLFNNTNELKIKLEREIFQVLIKNYTNELLKHEEENNTNEINYYKGICYGLECSFYGENYETREENQEFCACMADFSCHWKEGFIYGKKLFNDMINNLNPLETSKK